MILAPTLVEIRTKQGPSPLRSTTERQRCCHIETLDLKFIRETLTRNNLDPEPRATVVLCDGICGFQRFGTTVETLYAAKSWCRGPQVRPRRQGVGSGLELP